MTGWGFVFLLTGAMGVVTVSSWPVFAWMVFGGILMAVGLAKEG